MNGKPGYRKRKPAVKKSVRRPPKVAAKPTKMFAKNVKAVIHRMAEQKTYVIAAANNSIPICTGAAAPYQVDLLPQITQGSSTQQRVGNMINITSNKIKYCVNFQVYNAITNPNPAIYVKMWVVSLKNKSQYQGTPTVTDFSNFFQAGASTLNFQGNTLDTLLPVNNDLFTLHCTRTHMLGVVASTGASSGNWFGGSNNPQARGSIDLTKYVKKVLYNDNLAAPTDKSLWLVCQAVTMDGTTGTGYIPAELHYVHDIRYDDL